MYITLIYPLLARGRDRLETFFRESDKPFINIPYSLGDAIDWKRFANLLPQHENVVPYSLGDAIDWKLLEHKRWL